MSLAFLLSLCVYAAHMRWEVLKWTNLDNWTRDFSRTFKDFPSSDEMARLRRERRASAPILRLYRLLFAQRSTVAERMQYKMKAFFG